ncbi:MAG: hypothetical protein ABSG07_16780, partial [Terriglobales bacterium]
MPTVDCPQRTANIAWGAFQSAEFWSQNQLETYPFRPFILIDPSAADSRRFLQRAKRIPTRYLGR